MLDEYRSLVGNLIYYTIKIAPECANAIREMLQHMSNPGLEHWKAMSKFIGYLIKKEKHELFYREPKEYRSICYADLNYATNLDDRRSVSGIINTIGGMITHWTSKTQNAVTLSSTGAEYVSLVMCAQEVIFQNNLLEEMGCCEKPGIIHEDNTGAIFLVNNRQVSA